jgi:tetratricopeptide (TPR) repeat protein
MKLKTQRTFDRAKKMVKDGQTKEAKTLYEKILKEEPQNHSVKKALANIKNLKPQENAPREQVQAIINLFNEGLLDKAIDEINTLSNIYPLSPLLFNISGAFYKSRGQYEIAIQKFEHSINLKSNYAEAHYNLGVTLGEIGKINESITCYKNALNIKKEYPDVHNNLGNIYLDLSQYKLSIEHFEWAVAYKPDFAEAYNNLGITNRIIGRLDEAGKNFDKALSINPDFISAINCRGLLHQDMGQYDDAIKFYDKALRLDSNFVDAINNLGLLYKENNQIKNAIKAFEKAIKLNPNFANAYYNLIHGIKEYQATDKQVKDINSLLEAKNLSQDDRIVLNFTLAKVNEDLGKNKTFFKYLNEANKLRREKLNYSFGQSQDQNLFKEIKDIFNDKSSLTIENNLDQSTSIKPIFIVGMPRSGTSLVEQIISSHPEVYGAGELNAIGRLCVPLVMNKSSSSTKHNDEAKLIRSNYLDLLARFDSQERVITDKAPLNFRFIGHILSAFPEAKIIHLKRDPVAICWSIYKSNWSGLGNSFSYNMDDLVNYYGLYVDLMEFWHQKFPEKIYDISYEKLTTNQESESKKLIKHCGLDWDKKCLEFYKNTRAVKTASSLQVRQKMYQGSSVAWKKYESYIGPLINGLKSY